MDAAPCADQSDPSRDRTATPEPVRRARDPVDRLVCAEIRYTIWVSPRYRRTPLRQGLLPRNVAQCDELVRTFPVEIEKVACLRRGASARAARLGAGVERKAARRGAGGYRLFGLGEMLVAKPTLTTAPFNHARSQACTAAAQRVRSLASGRPAHGLGSTTVIESTNLQRRLRPVSKVLLIMSAMELGQHRPGPGQRLLLKAPNSCSRPGVEVHCPELFDAKQPPMNLPHIRAECRLLRQRRSRIRSLRQRDVEQEADSIVDRARQPLIQDLQTAHRGLNVSPGRQTGARLEVADPRKGGSVSRRSVVEFDAGGAVGGAG